MKNRDTLTKLTRVYKDVAPELYAALISERDQVGVLASSPVRFVALIGPGSPVGRSE